ncbi:MAG: hypothetical protein ACK2VA_02895 [Anaerolineae bacterium]|jgi:hypothetical protein
MSGSRLGKVRRLVLLVVAILAVAGSPSVSVAGQGRPAQHGPQAEQVQVTCSAAHRTTSWDERDATQGQFELPLLYLHRQRLAAPPQERTLSVAISGVAGGRELELELVSRHANVSTGQQHHLSRTFRLPGRPCTAADPCTLTWTVEASDLYSDFYTLRVRDGAQVLWQNSQADRPDLVALDTWDVGLDGYTARIYYATLFPFARGPNDLDNRLSPPAVTDFVEHVFTSLVAETWHTQFSDWGFGPIEADWDPDRIVEIIVTDPPFALMGGTGTYTVYTYGDGTLYPERRLWWHATNAAFQAYDSLENGYRVLYAHEFFHMVQWNAILSAGCSNGAWLNVFVEAQGKMAPSVQYPELEMRRDHVVLASSEYGQAAKRYLDSGLKPSYQALQAAAVHKYDASLYWRFLYEQSGDMRVLRTALEEMACRYETDIVAGLPGVMDAALVRAGSPFPSFEESLTGFARANYALRLQDGRCTTGARDACEGRHYDPDSIYSDPALAAELHYAGKAVNYDGSIPASYGSDLIEVYLDSSLRGQRVTVTLESADARFALQVWEVNGNQANRQAARLGAKLGDVGGRPRALTAKPINVKAERDGIYRFTTAQLDPAKCDRLALIITRLDANEHLDPVGRYRIEITSAAGA